MTERLTHDNRTLSRLRVAGLWRQRRAETVCNIVLRNTVRNQQHIESSRVSAPAIVRLAVRDFHVGPDKTRSTQDYFYKSVRYGLKRGIFHDSRPTLMNINELDELAKAATPGPWKLSGTEHVVAGGNYVVALDCISEDAKHIAAANPSAIRELIAAYRESVAALGAMVTYARADRCGLKIADDALDTAKRLGVE